MWNGGILLYCRVTGNNNNNNNKENNKKNLVLIKMIMRISNIKP